MKQYFIKAMGCIILGGLIQTSALAQQNDDKEKDKDKLDQYDEVVIRRTGDKDAKVTVEIKDNEVRVNGKPLSDFDDENVTVRKKKTMVMSRGSVGRLSPSSSPFRSGTWNLDDNAMAFSNSNSAFLGVTTERDDNGAKVTSVSDESPAEKAGLEEGDVITRINDTKIESPEDLVKAIGKFKPEEKVTVTYRRDNKEKKSNGNTWKEKQRYCLFSRFQF